VLVVSEFLDVLIKELPGLPPDHDIEFVIELMPCTAPIYKSPPWDGYSRISQVEEAH
jgi:hypothetical protein